MSTIKVDTYLTRGGASEIAIDKLKGASSASSISVVAEGGTNTTNLQQGLMKAWCQNTDAAVITDSLNIASGTDNSSGNYDLTFTNAMGNATYSIAGASLHAAIFTIGQQSGDQTTTFYQVIGTDRADSLAAVDIECHSQVGGDLA